MNKPVSLGDTIRDRRLALGYSLGQLATKVNKTASSIRAWERGDDVPSEVEASDLAAALDLDASLLVSLLGPDKVWESEEIEPVDVVDPWDGKDGDREDPDGSGGAEPPAELESEPDVEPAEPEDVVDDVIDDVVDDLPLPEGDGPEGPLAEPKLPVVEREEVAELFEAKTEAVPVVPATSVAVAQPASDPALAGASAQPFESRSDNPVIAAWDDLKAIYYRIFDPRRRWIYRVRFVLLLIAFYIMLQVLAWAGSNLLDAIGEVLDSISFSPGETPDVEA